ncbi:TlpA family protein disulfide reductase [Aestuariibaculum suncheonense]|uniref:TlpA family protein disulfide reductase n=1 Tax=Aestuariibaculum suncheonense TaxID=1028745 RepID=A0A8J6QBR6_9FLAO|nr:TlpA disulfide reductase family protein [Aestuariibaculum suncheonense]MBD0834740.1 TlpA family protein disulfide reductase [Aestuariibaculum suncheonense]
MRLFVLSIVVCFSMLSCVAQDQPTKFSKEALNDTFESLDGEAVKFKDIIKQYKGKTVVIDIWASWCSDCIKGMPKVHDLQEQFGEVTYLFLSLDKTKEAWKKGIEKYDVNGEHYFMQSGWKGPFGTFVQLDWIPRYMVVDKTGKIKLFKAIEADDQRIKEIL